MRLSLPDRSKIRREIRNNNHYISSSVIDSYRRRIEDIMRGYIFENKIKVKYDVFYKVAREGIMLLLEDDYSKFNIWFSNLNELKNLNKSYDETLPIYFIHIGK